MDRAMNTACQRRRAWLAGLAVLLFSAAAFSCSRPTSGTKKYPRAELLLEPTALGKPGVAERFVILDARTQKAFAEDRIPGARWVDEDAWAKAFDSGADAEGWSDRIGGLGIDRTSKVVVYDGSRFKHAARIWWILRFWGVDDVRLLNGGWLGWTAAGLPVERDRPRAPAPKMFTAVPQAKRLATKGQLFDALKDKSLQIVDARSEAEFCGIDRRENKHAGAHPHRQALGMDRLDRQENAAIQDGRSARRAFSPGRRGIAAADRRLLSVGGTRFRNGLCDGVDGSQRVRNYHASWGQWGNADDTPIVVESPRSQK